MQRQRTVKSFDSAWLASVTSRPATPGIEAVLLAQGRPVPARQGQQVVLAAGQSISIAAPGGYCIDVSQFFVDADVWLPLRLNGERATARRFAQGRDRRAGRGRRARRDG